MAQATQSTQGLTPLRQRMIEDMRKLSPKTQSPYIGGRRAPLAYHAREPVGGGREVGAAQNRL
jgi:hypothetical protein